MTTTRVLPRSQETRSRWRRPPAQPWNLIVFMVIPVIVAEVLAVTVYLVKNAVVRLSSNMTWYGIGDYIAVFSYLLGCVPVDAAPRDGTSPGM